jgi:hypothetical protein
VIRRGARRRRPVDRRYYGFIIRYVALLGTVPLLTLGAILAFGFGLGVSAMTYFVSVAATRASYWLGRLAGEEAGAVIAETLTSFASGVRPYYELLPWRGCSYPYRNWRWLLWLAGITTTIGYALGRVPTFVWITTDLTVLGALVAGGISYHANLRAQVRAQLYRYRRGLLGSARYVEPPHRRSAAPTLVVAALVAGVVTVLANEIGDRAARGSPVFWLVAAAALLAVLEPVTDHWLDSVSERRAVSEFGG